ncbi:D-arabinono-1,4-lactone oxidase [Nocardioides massiliensis]|uniref:L-gulonolactone oxidase n=1 Tax=Nocardioides massiliensis TaxID=1325935 RepID=A0ABT9NQT2_9ACTN|nr:D-arabinono-1,4-lactone oxidase [Nocardioides massiliensis]MDP9822738.1 L-gulonolactone oxidase [Nocardioides massiliensis]
MKLGTVRRWRSWSGLVDVVPTTVHSPTSATEVAQIVADAAASGRRVKMVGTGHSFTDIAVADDVMLDPARLSGIVGVDREAMTVTALAGTRLRDLNAGLAARGLSLHNMGDIDAQTIAGAISTGTHGTGGVWSSLSAQVVGLELVTGTGEVWRCTDQEHADVLACARLGLGALGILTTVTLRVEPLFVLEAHEEVIGWDAALESLESLAHDNHHVDGYWFPGTDRVQVKRNNRLAVGVEEREPLPRWRAVVEDEVMANGAFGVLTRLGARVPALVPGLNRFAASQLSARTYSDIPHRVFTAPRRVVFREMEYAVPREAGTTVLREVRSLIERRGWRIGFPVEIRMTPADDVPLSASYGRDSTYLAFHTPRAADHTSYFAGVEEVLRAHDGRPHWGKLHARTAADLAPAYPRWDDFAAVRDRVDPQRVFTNAYLRRVLGS